MPVTHPPARSAAQLRKAGALRAPPNLRAPDAHGLPPVRVNPAPVDLGDHMLSWKIFRMGAGGGGRVMLSVFTKSETVHLRQVAAAVGRHWCSSNSTMEGTVLLYCRATLGGSPKTRGWLGIASSVIFYIADGDAHVDTLIPPVDVVELVRDDELSTVDIRSKAVGRKTAVFAVQKQRLDEVVSRLVAVCDDTKASETAPEELTSGCASPPPFSPTGASPAHTRNVSPGRPPVTWGVQADQPSPKSPFRSLSPPSTMSEVPPWWVPLPATPPRAEYGPLTYRQLNILANGLEVSGECNGMKWGRGGRFLGYVVGEGARGRLQHLAAVIIEGVLGARNDLVDELVKGARAPPGLSVVGAMAFVARKLWALHPSGGVGPLGLLLLRMLSQEGPDTDRMLGFPDVPVLHDEEWRIYTERYCTQRNAALHLSVSQALCDAASRLPTTLASLPLLEERSWTVAALVAISQRVEGGPALFRPAELDYNTYECHRGLEEGELYGWLPPAGCLVDERHALSFLDSEKRHSNVLFRITGPVDCLPISSVSQYPRDHEALIAPFSLFTVSNVVDTHYGLLVELASLGCVARSHPRFRELEPAVRLAEHRLTSLTFYELLERQEAEERSVIEEQEALTFVEAKRGFFLKGPDREVSCTRDDPSPARSASRSIPPPPYDSPRRSASPSRDSTALVAAAPLALPDVPPDYTQLPPGDGLEVMTLRDATRLIRFQASTIKDLRWQLSGLQGSLSEGGGDAKVAELMAQRNQLILDRERYAERVREEAREEMRRDLLRDGDLQSLSREDLLQRLAACQDELRHVIEQRNSNDQAVLRACQDRAKDELVSSFLQAKEECLGDDRLRHLSADELRDLAATLAAENRVLLSNERLDKAEEEAAALRAEVEKLRESHRSLAMELESRDADLIKSFQAAVRLEAGLAPQVDVETSHVIHNSPGSGGTGMVFGSGSWKEVVRVEAGSPADLAGVRPGCFVVAVDGNPVEDPNTFHAVLESQEVVHLTVRTRQIDYRPASQVKALCDSIKGVQAAIEASERTSPPVPARHSKDFEENHQAIRMAWGTITTHCEMLRQLYLLRSTYIATS